MILNPAIFFTFAILLSIYYWYSFQYFDRTVDEETKQTSAETMSKVSLGLFSTIVIYLVLNLAYYVYMSLSFTQTVSKYQFFTELIGNLLMKL